MSIEADFSEVHRMGVELGKVAGRMVPEVDSVMKKAAQNVKDGMVADANASQHFSGIAPAISYDRAYGLGSVGYEVGVERGRTGQAPLAGIAYFGGVNSGGGTLDIDAPLKAEEPRLLKALSDLGDLL